jgi:PAP2 superfamily
MKTRMICWVVAVCSLGWFQSDGHFQGWAQAQFQGSAKAESAADITVLKGLAAVSVLLKTPEGRAALGANLRVTGGIQTGTMAQPTLLPFPEQQQQALKDAFITYNNLAQLADGLGTTLGAAYLARFHYIDAKQTSKMPAEIADVISKSQKYTSAHSGAGKFLFGNETVRAAKGKDMVPAPPELAAILTDIGGTPDVFGKAYGLTAGSTGADPYGDSRPFQTEPSVTIFSGRDYLSVLSDNYKYNHGPAMDLRESPSYPSGHTTYGYTGAVLLAVLVPERYEQMIVRGAEYGNDRILMGSHYTMDVLGGRTLALYDMAHLLATKEFREAVEKARKELKSKLEEGCGNTIEVCAKEDTGRFSDAEANEAFYATTQTYSLPVVYAKNASTTVDVAKVAPEAGYLLTVAFPSLTVEQADKILTETEGPGGGFLDTDFKDGAGFGVYSRLNLVAAARVAAQAAAGK